MNPFSERMNEIIFEKRNKTYGAYVLRKEYANSLRTALFYASVFAGLVVLLGVFVKKGETIKLPDLDPPRILDSVWQIDPTPPKSKEPETFKKIPPPPPSAPPEGLKEVVDEELPADTEPPKPPAEAGPSNPNGTGDPKDVDPGQELGGGGPEVIEKKEDKPFVYVKEMPTIEGGILKYVQRHLNYPWQARENRTSGTVHISFIVERDGSISNIEILNNPKIGDGCEEEAIRVIKSATWIPGRNNGEPARVQLTLPVRYQIQ